MIQREFYTQRKDGVKLYRTYSDAGMMIQQNETGAEYAEAIDVEGASYTYTETETRIPAEEAAEDTDALRARQLVSGRYRHREAITRREGRQGDV